ncbi:hypothetical protein NEPAR06_0219 [Nematocida parisii]|uniref:Uncharacterized protein n=1 Tax=Nematocida parisii (strain ERTm3) TaxID=935791 RepID=I3EDB2_NEMP3|nr:uncharacterized protein NEPG_00617 [Nematocida parisii ERTm1]EIJ87209.1 hypothetical protein NEQG_02544 [Nematocida parisii ERTm3]KAI5126594.1 hypothetical protein NEPAR08_0513 [Nematocida parisii]EIJ95092.1 hypothetical protein NEPG_00617 [Nematocida parisii ERTm1]KAI5127877.1 hypothetical protein NEPAR03_1157 [Nematocida parisii]KAI5143184.1 hypothetical protein NEPAR07_0546 [Nematocida parisii]|eukprot:XP_013058448.1 hypothetical protein NEPG_00617 [Nematocida parisii ERTm1]
MSVTEAVARIELAEEFEFDPSALSVIESASISSETEFKQVCLALFRNYWGLPKIQKQEKWADFVLTAIEKRADRNEFFARLMECIKQEWRQIDIRLKPKFVNLVIKLIEIQIKHTDAQIDKFITKGPDAEFDWPIMKAVIRSKESLSTAETEYLLDYLTKNANTYFMNFFIKHVLPILKRDGVTKEIADRAYTEGSSKTTSAKMKELFYSIHACAP